MSFAAKKDNLSSVSGTRMVERKDISCPLTTTMYTDRQTDILCFFCLSVSVSLTHTQAHTHRHTHTGTHTHTHTHRHTHTHTGTHTHTHTQAHTHTHTHTHQKSKGEGRDKEGVEKNGKERKREEETGIESYHLFLQILFIWTVPSVTLHGHILMPSHWEQTQKQDKEMLSLSSTSWQQSTCWAANMGSEQRPQLATLLIGTGPVTIQMTCLLWEAQLPDRSQKVS
jgi:hypothetical protein